MKKFKKLKAKKRVAPKVVREQKLYPGRPNYTGPNKGWFAFVHHGCLAERSNDIARRVKHIKTGKPQDERQIRLSHLMYLGGSLNRKLTTLLVFGETIHRPDNTGGDLVMQYVNNVKPKHRWNGHSLTFPDGVHLHG